MKITAKDADQSQYWLCECSKTYPDCKKLPDKVKEINQVLDKTFIQFEKKNT